MYFAAKDIKEENINVLKGHPLPDRFQTYQAAKNLKAILGESVLIDINSTTKGFVMVDANRLSELEKELTALRAENEKLKAKNRQ